MARPEEAVSCFLRTGMDGLVLGSYYATGRRSDVAAVAKRSFKVLEANTLAGD